MAEVLSLPLTSSELPKLLLALYSGLSLEDLSQLGFFLLLLFFFLRFVFVCHFFSSYIRGVGEKKIKVPREHPQGTV